MKKILALLLAALMIITALAACQGTPDSGQAQPAENEAGENEADAGEEKGDEAGTDEVYTIKFFDKNSGTKVFGEDR